MSRRRYDALHKATTDLAKNHGVVAIEDLSSKRMSRKGGRRKAGLNRGTLGQSWGIFQRLSRYELEERGGEWVEVPAASTSQRCSECEHVDAANRPAQAVFRCVECGHSDNANTNAARDILGAAGHAVTACGGDVSPGGPRAPRAAPSKQEPMGSQLALF